MSLQNYDEKNHTKEIAAGISGHPCSLCVEGGNDYITLWNHSISINLLIIGLVRG